MLELKKLRLENGLKRSEFARLIGIHQNTIANYENGVCEAPYDILIKFADFFDISIDELLGREKLEINKSNNALLTKQEKTILSKYRSLSDNNRTRLEDYLDILIKAENKDN